MKKLKWALAILTFSLHVAQAVPAAPISVPPPLKPVEKQWGVYLSSLGDSALGFISLNGAYDPSPDWRLTVGVAELFGTAFGAGVKYRFLPEDCAIRMFAGMNTTLLLSNFASSLASALTGGAGVGTTQAYVYFGPGLGFDWKTGSGFYLALGGNVWWSFSASGASFIPFLNLGWFF